MSFHGFKTFNPLVTVDSCKYTLFFKPHHYRFPSTIQIPLTKSKILAPNEETKNKAPRISCDLCKYTYNLRTGEQLEESEATGFFGGIAKSVLGSQEGGDLPTYQLGEKNGRIMFTMEGM